ncbi:hypothetical protein L596_013575 [Steinernema carpocapsae]|uniref:Uncharacterized protein n=1 Tax=Steinernema carpocapsae TaxID=34508 RepID=A0A4U5P0K3_STECR|nr:hypothetical protein L596_013575 [Steinernema carpocapsae]
MAACDKCLFLVDLVNFPSPIRIKSLFVKCAVLDEEVAKAMIQIVTSYRFEIDEYYRSFCVDVKKITASIETITAILSKVASLKTFDYIKFCQNPKNERLIRDDVTEVLTEFLPKFGSRIITNRCCEYNTYDITVGSKDVLKFYDALKFNPNAKYLYINIPKKIEPLGLLSWEDVRLLIKDVLMRPFRLSPKAGLGWVYMKIQLAVNTQKLRIKNVFKESFIKKKKKKGKRVVYQKIVQVPWRPEMGNLMATWYLELEEKKGNNIYTLIFKNFIGSWPVLFNVL